jgi:hypothetical protein
MTWVFPFSLLVLNCAFRSIRKEPLQVGIGRTFENDFASNKHDDFIGILVDQVEVM